MNTYVTTVATLEVFYSETEVGIRLSYTTELLPKPVHVEIQRILDDWNKKAWEAKQNEQNK